MIHGVSIPPPQQAEDRREAPHATGGSVEAALWIQGMHCAACSGLIEAAVRNVPGVQSIRVSASLHRAQVRWRPDVSSLAQIVQAIQAAGYGAEPAGVADQGQVRAAERKQLLWQLFVAWFCAMQVMMLATPAYVAADGDMAPDLLRLLNWAQWLLCLPVMWFSASPFLSQAWRALRQRRIVMDVPVALGMVVMFGASTVVSFNPGGPLGDEVVFDSLSMFVAILLTGRWVEMRLRHHAAASLEHLLRDVPQRVERLKDHGGSAWVDASALQVGDRLRVAAGERFAADAVILKGSTSVSQSLMTGESLPVVREPGQSVWRGSVNQGHPVEVCVTAIGQDTHWARLLDLAERAALERPPLVAMADRWAAPFLWGVMALALFSAGVWWWIEPTRALWVAVSVLVVTCPCALSLAAPAALTAAARAFAQHGVLLQRLSALEDLARIDQVVFDKTGTLTLDRLSVVGARLSEGAAAAPPLLAHAATLAAWSRHPASRALVRAAGGGEMEKGAWSEVQERPGLGLEAIDETGQRWRLGRMDWVSGTSATAESSGVQLSVSSLQLAFGPVGRPLVAFDLQDTMRPDAQMAIAALRSLGVTGFVLSGDAPERVAGVAAQLGLPVLRAGATPADKQMLVESLQRQGHVVAMVGDGINDAPVLGQAHVAIAMGQGSAAAAAQADLVIWPPRLAVLPQLIVQARRAQRVMRQNLFWALAYNLLAIPLALAGWLPPWAAGLGMTLSSLFVVLNSWRAGAPASPTPVNPP